MAVLLTVDDLAPFAEIAEAKAEAMIADAVALAALVAPCLTDPDLDPPLTAEQLAAAKAVLRAAVLRWDETGSGVFSGQTFGPFGTTTDTRTPARRGRFWPTEIEDLQKICLGDNVDTGGAFSIDTAAPPMLFHSVLCGWAGGGCTCGADAFDNMW